MAKRKEISITNDKVAATVERLASFGLTNTDIALALNTENSVLKAQYETEIARGRALLRQKLLVKQIQVAMKGNVGMLIWLGKQYLDQSDHVEKSGEITIVLERKDIV